MSLIIARAIRSIDPDSRFSIQSGIVDWETSPIDQSLVDAEVARLQTEYDSQEYARSRQTEYPPIGDQLDAILKHLNYRRTQGDELIQELDDVVGDWLSVKARYPK